MNKFEIFDFDRSMMLAAERSGWRHTPQNDRFLNGVLTTTFEKIVDGDQVASVKINFNVQAKDMHDALVHGTAEMKTPMGVMSAEIWNACGSGYRDFTKLFDPIYYMIDKNKIKEAKPVKVIVVDHDPAENAE